MKLRSVVIGFLIAVIFSTAILFILALLSYFTSVDEGIISASVYAGAAVSIFIGALYAARTCGSKILLNSLSVSMIYLAALATISLIIHHGIVFNMHFAAVIASGLGSGFLGAVVGK